jgi:hypothetical protein
MEMLNENEMAKLASLGCQPVFDCTDQLHCLVLGRCVTWMLRCGPVFRCLDLNWCRWLNTCDGRLYQELTDKLTACGEGFYIKCPGFDDLGKVCEFEPAFDATKWREQIQLDKVAKLEAKVQELEVALKKKG